MTIIIEMSLFRFADELINHICKDYGEKIDKVYRYKREIKLKNGDSIRVISSTGRNDGIRADTAIGPMAEYFTCGSKQSKRVWNYDDLEKYLENL